MSRKAEFLNIIRPILDRSQVDKDANDLALELQDKLGELKVGLDKSGLKEFEEAFNEEMVKLGKQPIVLSNISIGDHTIRDMAKQIAGVVGSAISNGVKNSVKDALAEIEKLEKSKKPKIDRRQELKNKTVGFESLQTVRLRSKDVHPRPLAKESDINEQARKIYEKFKEAKDALSGIDSIYDDAEYDKILDNFYDAVNDMYRMRQTIKNYMDEFTDDKLKSKFKFDNLNASVDEAFEMAGTSLDEYISIRSRVYKDEIHKLGIELKNIDNQIAEIKNNNSEIINKEAVNSALKSLEEVEKALDRMRNKTKKKDVNKNKLDSLQSTLSYDAAAENNKNILGTLSKGLNAARQNGAGWEEEYQWIVKFVKQYKYLQDNGMLSDHLKKQYGALFNELVGMAENAETSLRTLIDRAEGRIQPSKIIDNKEKLPIEKESVNMSERQAQAQNDAADAAERERKATEATLNAEEKRQKLLLYRIGKTKFNPDRFRNQDMMGNSVEARMDGFGGYGDGLFAVVGSSMLDIIKSDIAPTDPESYFEFDASKYNLWFNKTVEQAEAVSDFSNDLQKFILAAGDFRGFDDDIDGIDEQTLFAQATQVFGQINMSKEQFAEWISSMKQLVVNNGLNSEGVFAKADESFLNSRNFFSRFMISQGYQGLINDTGDDDIDGMYHGSVIYEPDFKEITEYIQSNEVAFKKVKDFLLYITQSKEKVNDIINYLNEGGFNKNHPIEPFDLTKITTEEVATHQQNTQAVKEEVDAKEELIKKNKELANTQIPSEEEIKSGKASWYGMPIKYDASLPNEARNVTDYMKIGDKFFDADEDSKKYILDHEVAHNIADRIMYAMTNNWAQVADTFTIEKMLPKGANVSFYTEEDDEGNRWYREGLYGDLGATAVSETITRAVNEYFSNPESLQHRSSDAYGFIEKYLYNSGDNLDNAAAVKEELAVQEQLNDAKQEGQRINQQSDVIVANNQKKIESYEELKRVLQEYYDAMSNVKKMEHTDTDWEWDSLTSNLGIVDDEGVTKAFQNQWKRVAAIQKSVKDGADAYIDPEDKTAYRISENTLNEEQRKLQGMAAAYVLDFEQLTEKQRKFVEKISTAYDKWSADYDKRLDELNVINKPHEDKAFSIENSIGKQLQNQDMSSYSSFSRALNDVGSHGVTEQSLRVIGNLIGIEIPQSAETAKQAVDGLNTSLEKQQQIEQANASLAQVAETNVETEAIAQQNEELKENISLKQMVENASKHGVPGQSVADAAGVSSGDEVAFVGTNKQDLQSILSKITYNVKIVHDDADKTVNKIALDDSSLEATLKRVFASILNPITEQNDENVQEPWALESTLQTVKGILDNIQTNTAKIGTAEVTTVADDGVLVAIKTAVESINKKIVQGTKVINTGTKKKKTEEKSSGIEIKNPKTLGNIKATKVDARVNALQGLYEQRGKLLAKQTVYPSQAAQEEINQLNKSIKLKFKELNIEEEKRNALKQSLMTRQEETKQSEKSLLLAQKSDDIRKKQAQETARLEKANLRERMRLNKEQYRVGAATSAGNSGNKVLESLWKIDAKEKPLQLKEVKDLQVSLEALRQARNKVNESIKQGKQLMDDNGNEAQELKDLKAMTMAVNQQSEAVKKLIANYNELSSDNDNVKETGHVAAGGDIETQMRNIAKEITNGQAKIGDFDATTGRLKYTVKTGAYEFQEYELAVRDVGQAIVALNRGTKRTETFFESFKRKLGELTRYFSASSLIFKVFNEFKKGIQYIREIDSALTELKKVTDETEETYDKFLDTASKTAAKVGSTIKDVISSTADWARLGYSMQEAAQLAESTQILMNVSEFTNISDATDSLISSIQAFKYTANESMDVVDILNTIGNNYAISTSDLAKSLTKSSGALVSANNTLEEAVALTAAANTIIQDADVVGTALKTASMRIRGTSIDEMEEEGLDTYGFTSQSNLKSKIMAISGVDILTDTGAYKSTYQILSEISEVWDDITDDKARAGLLELLAGKRSGSVIASILDNPETLKNAFEDANNAAGSALKENEKYLDSIQGRIDLFNNSVQTMWNNLLDSDAVKWFVDLGTKVVKLIDDVGALRLAFAAFITYVAQKGLNLNFANIFSGLTSKGINLIFGKKVNADIQSTQDNLLKLQRAAKDAKQAYVDAPNATNKANLDAANENLATYEKLQKEGYKTSNNNLGYFGREIQKIKDYKQELKNLDVQIPQAEEKLKSAQEDYNQYYADAEYYGGDLDELNKYSDAVKDAQNNVDVLKQKQADLKKTGSGAFQSLADGANKLTKQIQSAVASMLVMYAISKVIQIASDLLDDMTETAEEAKESFEELSSELSETESKLSSLESQLKNINEQIEEINSNTPLTFSEQEELSRLEAESAELQRQIDLMNTLKEQQQLGVNSSAINAANKYSQTGVKTGKTTKENVGSKAATGAGVGAAVGVASGVGTAILGAKAGTALGSWAGPIGMLIGAAIGALAGGIIGAVAGGIESASEEKVGEKLDNMQERYEKLQEKFNNAREDYQDDPTEKNKKKFEKAQKAFNDYKSEVSNYMIEMDGYYSQIKTNWDVATSAQKKEYEEWADQMDQWAISSGSANAKSNAITRIFGENADKELQDIKEKIKDATSDENWNGDVNLEDYFSPEKLDAFIARLHEMGIYAYEVEDYFKDAQKAEDDFIDMPLNSVISDINKIADGLSSVKSAFEEVIDKGYITSQTLSNLKDEFGIDESSSKGLKNAWNAYLETMMSGTVSSEEMQKATEDFVTTWLNEQILTAGAITAEQRTAFIAQLRGLGVLNAEEYIDDALKENLYKDVANNFKTPSARDQYIDTFALIPKDLPEAGKKAIREQYGALYDAMSDSAKAEFAKGLSLDAAISDEQIAKIAEKYGVEEDAIRSVVDQLKEKQNLENDLLALQGKQKDYNEFLNGDGTNLGVRALEEELDAMEEFAEEYEYLYELHKSFNVNQWIQGEEGGIWRNTYTRETLSDDEYTKKSEDRKRATAWLTENREKYNEYLELKAKYEELWKYGEEQGYIIDGEIIDPGYKKKIDEVEGEIDAFAESIDNEYTAEIKLKLELQEFDEGVDRIQDAYSTLKDITTEYNTQGYLSLDNLQALLNLSPEYLACLQMEGGQLTINQSALEAMLKTKLADAEATAVQTAITQLNALAERKKAIEVSNSAVAANQAAIQLGTYSNALDTVAQDAIVAAGSVAAFNAALQGAQGNAFVSDDEINQILSNFNNSVELINSVKNNLPKSFNQILDPGSKTSPEEVAESEWDKLVARYERELALITNERDLIEAEIDKAEARGGQASAQYYEDLIRNSNEEKELLEAKKTALENYLAANKGNIDPETWTEYNNEINETAVAIKECETNTIEWEEALREIDFHYFEQATDEISRLGEELDFVNGLLEDEEVADENGNWSSAALTRLGLYTQQMEMAAVEAQRYQDEIDKLNSQYANGELSEEKYKEKLSDLVSGQQDAIQSYEDAKDSIIELNEARIDTIKDGIDKEIEAYEDLIDLKKEELDAERDLYDFRKNVKKQTKDIASLERRIASLSGSTAASDIAERRKLQAQLNEAREGLNDTYYERSKDQQSQALDEEAEAFSQSKEKYIEQLEEQLKDTETLIQQSLMDVLLNADSIYEQLAGEEGIAAKYGIQLSDKLTQPWKDASAQAISWKNELQNSMTAGEYAALIGEGGAITAFANGVATKMQGSWNTAQNAVKGYSDFLTGTELGNRFSSTITSFANQIQLIIDKWNGVKKAADDAYTSQTRKVEVGGNPNVGESNGSGDGNGGGGGNGDYQHQSDKTKALQEILNTVFGADLEVDGKLGPATKAALKAVQNRLGISADGLFGEKTKQAIADYIDKTIATWRTMNGSQVGQGIQVYKQAKEKLLTLSKGTLGTSRDQLAITDESWIGEEITLAAGKNGQLQYLKKGSAVMPADISANLVEWGKLNPNMLNVGGGANINMISNAVTKPEFNFDVENFLKVERVDKDTLPELEKMMDKKIDNLVRQLNYSLKKFK